MICCGVGRRHAKNTHGYAVTVFVSAILWNYDVPFVYSSAKSNVRGHQKLTAGLSLASDALTVTAISHAGERS